jgi:hypothetical protein
MRSSQILVVTSLLAGACAPQSAELISGEFVAFVADSNSVTLRKEQLKLDEFAHYERLDCRFFLTEDAGESQRLEDRLPVCGWGDEGDDEGHFFRDTDGNNEEYDGDPVLDINDYDDDDDGIYDYYDCDDNDPDVGAAGTYEITLPSGETAEFFESPANCSGGGDGFWPPVQEPWLGRDGFHVVAGEMSPWRGEGIVTHEGDLQVGFHHSMPGSADIRFYFAIDRFFQPTECVVDGDEVVASALDGDWIDEWSEATLEHINSLRDDEEAFAPYEHLEPYLDGGRVYMLNSNGYQYNPDENIDWWYTPEQWSAGAAAGFFGEERIQHRPPIYAEPELYDLFASLGIGEGEAGDLGDLFTDDYLWWCETELGEDWETNDCLRILEERIHLVADQAQQEFSVAVSDEDGDNPAFSYRPVVHMNKWRNLDGVAPGYDSWGELVYSYVVISENSDLRVGGTVEGAFTLVMDGADTTSRVFLKGQFKVDKLKNDRWVPQDLREEKREESGVDFCAF